MMTKVFDLLRSLGWYLVHFIYDLIDGLLQIIKKLNAFDIINSLSNNQTFRSFYTGAMAIAVTLFALFIIWKFVNKLLDPDEETTFKYIMMEVVKCGTLIMMSTFLFVQVSNFSITLSNYTGNLFESSTNNKMSDTMLTMFIVRIGTSRYLILKKRPKQNLLRLKQKEHAKIKPYLFRSKMQRNMLRVTIGSLLRLMQRLRHMSIV